MVTRLSILSIICFLFLTACGAGTLPDEARQAIADRVESSTGGQVDINDVTVVSLQNAPHPENNTYDASARAEKVWCVVVDVTNTGTSFDGRRNIFVWKIGLKYDTSLDSLLNRPDTYVRDLFLKAGCTNWEE